MNRPVHRSVKWQPLIFCIVWFIGAGLVLVLYLTDQLQDTFPVPRFIGWIYDWFGVVAGSLLQLLLTGIGIVWSFRKKG